MIQRLMRARSVVVVKVLGEDPNQVCFAEDDDVLKAIATD